MSHILPIAVSVGLWIARITMAPRANGPSISLSRSGVSIWARCRSVGSKQTLK